MNTALPTAVGFPAPLLGSEALRLPVLAASAGALVLDKPAGVAWEAVTGGVATQAAAGKPELLAFGLRGQIVAVWPLDAAVSGPLLLAERGERSARWRNAFGSEQLEFVFELLATGDAAGDSAAGGGDVFECALPVAWHRDGSRALVSNTTGKKARTLFRRIARAGTGTAAARWSWWEARTRYPRPDQIRLHAAECGLRLAGETLYAAGDAITLESLATRGRVNKGVPRPLHDGLVLRLARVLEVPPDTTGDSKSSAAGDALFAGILPLFAPEPPRTNVLRRRLADSG
ncbi:MAG: hypothetical protein LBR07_01660 [Puniceicoccales bacterium]|nr:hypothetical protein [Puniceicoccales bacterium]